MKPKVREKRDNISLSSINTPSYWTDYMYSIIVALKLANPFAALEDKRLEILAIEYLIWSEFSSQSLHALSLSSIEAFVFLAFVPVDLKYIWDSACSLWRHLNIASTVLVDDTVMVIVMRELVVSY